METRNELLLNENQHRLLMCMRMAKALGVGEIYLDATTHKMHWRLEKEGHSTRRFYSIEEMETHLEHLLENRSRVGLTGMTPCMKRRAKVMSERQRSRTNGTPMLFQSRINGM